MSFFERLRRKDKTQTAQAAGNVSIAGAMQESPTPSPVEEIRAPRATYATELDNRRQALDVKQRSLMERLHGEGLTGMALNAAVAQAMHAGELPTITFGRTYRGSSFHLRFISGDVQAEHINASAETRPYGTGQVFIYAINPSQAAHESPDIRIENSPRLPGYEDSSRFPFDQPMLDKIDAHMAGIVENSPATAMPQPVRPIFPRQMEDDLIL